MGATAVCISVGVLREFPLFCWVEALGASALAERVDVRDASKRELTTLMASPASHAQLWTGGAQYVVDLAQRSVLFWDTLRRRGNNFLEHANEPFLIHTPPVPVASTQATTMNSTFFSQDLEYVRNRTFHEIAVGDSASIERMLTAADIQLLRTHPRQLPRRAPVSQAAAV